MSSAPSGLDAREYLYGSFSLPLELFGTYVISAAGEWAVTRVQLFAAADQAATLDGPNYGPTNEVAAGGCLVLEPNGAYRDAFRVSGGGGLFIVEFWFQARGTVGQSINIYVEDPGFTETVFRRSLGR